MTTLEALLETVDHYELALQESSRRIEKLQEENAQLRANISLMGAFVPSTLFDAGGRMTDKGQQI